MEIEIYPPEAGREGVTIKEMTALKNKGFTLIELLIVIAILGVLAIVVLIAINPVQQLARTRDAGRKSGVTQVGHAVEAFYTSRSAYPNSTNWASIMTAAGELSAVPGSINYSAGTITTGCGTDMTNGLCYKINGTTTQAVVYSRLESETDRTKCATGDVWFVYSTADGRGGIVCGTEASVPASNQSWNSIQ